MFAYMGLALKLHVQIAPAKGIGTIFLLCLLMKTWRAP
jgi:hypothetical protein